MILNFKIKDVSHESIQIKYIFIYLSLYFITFMYSHTYAQSFSSVDRTRMPFFMCGKYSIDKVIVVPQVLYWDHKLIEAEFQSSDTTYLSDYLKKTYFSNTLPDLLVKDTLIYYRLENQISNKIKHILGFATGTLMPHTVRHSQKDLGQISFKVPIVTEAMYQLITGHFNFPEMNLVLEGSFQHTITDNSTKEHTVYIYAHMTHRVEFEDHDKLTPIIPIDKTTLNHNLPKD